MSADATFVKIVSRLSAMLSVFFDLTPFALFGVLRSGVDRRRRLTPFGSQQCPPDIGSQTYGSPEEVRNVPGFRLNACVGSNFTQINSRIGQMRRITAARPDYFSRQGRPHHPEDLKHHDCIVYSGLATVDEWHFTGRDCAPIVVRVAGRIRVNASERMLAALLECLGLAVCPTWLFGGEVERVLEDFEPAALPIQAVYPSRRLVPPRVRAFVDFLQAEFKADPRLGD
jgi:hypothetical protein